MSMFSTPSSKEGAVAAVTVCRKGYRFTTTCTGLSQLSSSRGAAQPWLTPSSTCHIDRLDAVLAERVHVGRVLPPCQDASVHCRVQRLDSPCAHSLSPACVKPGTEPVSTLQHLRKVSDVLHVRDSDASSLYGLEAPACRHQLVAQLGQALRAVLAWHVGLGSSRKLVQRHLPWPAPPGRSCPRPI